MWLKITWFGIYIQRFLLGRHFYCSLNLLALNCPFYCIIYSIQSLNFQNMTAFMTSHLITINDFDLIIYDDSLWNFISWLYITSLILVPLLGDIIAIRFFLLLNFKFINNIVLYFRHMTFNGISSNHVMLFCAFKYIDIFAFLKTYRIIHTIRLDNKFLRWPYITWCDLLI